MLLATHPCLLLIRKIRRIKGEEWDPVWPVSPLSAQGLGLLFVTGKSGSSDLLLAVTMAGTNSPSLLCRPARNAVLFSLDT